MDFNKWIEKIDGMAGIYAFDIMEDGSFGEIKLMGVNSKNRYAFEANPNAPEFYPGIPWRSYFTDLNFESFIYRCASTNNQLYSYVNAHGFWLKGFYLPLIIDDASFTGLVAKENIVGTMGTLYGGGDQTAWQALAAAFTGVTGFSFLVFNLLCAPCFAAIGAIKRDMNNAKWTWFAVGYQCGFAYVISLMINQFGGLFTGKVNVVGLIFAIAILAGMIYMLVRPYKEASKLSKKLSYAGGKA